MKNIFFLFSILFIACNTQQTTLITSKKDTIAVVIGNTDTSAEMATYFLVIVDTSTNYYSLNNKMYQLSNELNISIDTMGRHFNQSKNLIALPDNDEDEIYAGDYFPRRYQSTFLSLEYLDFYTKKASKKTIALIAGIYETQHSADSCCSILQQKESKSFILKANIYLGCMH